MSCDDRDENRMPDNANGDSNPGHKDSLHKRYFFKLSSNLLGLVIALISQMIIPRGLGPKVYGDFNFLSNFFTQTIGFLDMGTSTCFYTNVSRRPGEYQLVSFYTCFAALVAVLILGFVILTHLLGIHSTVWLGQGLVYIYLAAGWGILSWIVQLLGSIADAYGMTVPAEKARMLQRILGLVFIVLLYCYHQLYLPQFFFYHYCILIFLIAALIVIIGRKIYPFKKELRLSGQRARKYLGEFFNYSHPVFMIAAVVFVEGIFDRWLLQYYGGSIQQGFYSLSYQVGTICFLFTGAMTPLLMREYSIHYGTKDFKEMGRLFKRYLPMLYAIAAFFSCFLMIQADNVVHIFGGAGFQGGMMAVAIMAMYPVHQTYGQLTSSLFYATGRTRLYRNISVFFSLVGLPATYFMIAPVEGYGLDAGATGLAIKMVVINIIGVNVQLYFNTKIFRFSYWYYLVHQVLCILVFTSLAALSTYGVRLIFMNQAVSGFLFSGIIYTSSTIALVFLVPGMFGVNKKEVMSVMQEIRNRMTVKS